MAALSLPDIGNISSTPCPGHPPASGLFHLLTSPVSWLTVLCLYASLCSALRFRREKVMRRRFNYPTRESMARMTNSDAQQILQYLATQEFPLFYTLSLQFAILKTYAFSTMSKLMAANKTFSDPTTSPKRYEDTYLIFAEFSMNPPTSDRCIRAISRMNYLHNQYKVAGQISNADFLYTLAVCVTQPIRFMRMYEWRPPNDMEVCAIGTFWKSIGDAMQIEYRGFLSRQEWKDGIEFVDDITAWAAGYELDAMRPARTNRVMADSLIELLIYHIPVVLKPFVTELLVVVMGQRVSEAFLFPEPGIVATAVAFSTLSVRRYVLRYLVLPRLIPFAYVSDPNPLTGRINNIKYLVEPWYVKPTLWSRWGPMALVTRLMGGSVPCDAFQPHGFLHAEFGTKAQQGKGATFMQENEGWLRKHRPSGCPFSASPG